MTKNLIRLSLSFPLANVKRINFGARRVASTTPFVSRVGICYIVCSSSANKKGASQAG
jgi:hypothetical protein